MKKILALLATAVMALSISACKETADPGFAGSWIEQNSSVKQPRYLDIHLDHGLYQVDERVAVAGIYKTFREVAKVEGDNVLSVKNGFRTLTLKDGVIYYRTKSFVRIP